MNLLSATGPWMYPLLGAAACLLAAIVHATVVTLRTEKEDRPVAPAHHAVLAWGVLGAVVGLLGTLVGFGRVALGAREATGAGREDLEAMMTVLWDGAVVIVPPVIAGLWLFSMSVVAWLVLHYLLRSRLG